MYLKKSNYLTLAALLPLAAVAQSFELQGVRNTMRYDDGEDSKTTYLGWNSETGTAMFSGDVGLWSLKVNEASITSELVHYENLMYGNSGSVRVNNTIYTVMSHEDPDATTEGQMEFVVRKWNAETFDLISSQRFPKSANIESRGMAFNPVDKQVYGLFYLTDVALPVPDEELDQEDQAEGYTTDAGYALCTIDLNTMAISQITPGIYYDNFITLACSPTGRLFSITSGGSLVEFDSATGLIVGVKPTGVQSQFKRQAACFDYNTGKMYWNGFVNSGMGVNEWGSWGPLSDRDCRTNGKYDTALYEVDLETGNATLLHKIPNRIAFSCLWVVGGDASVLVGIDLVSAPSSANAAIYDIHGHCLYRGDAKLAILPHGLYILRQGNSSRKIIF